MSIALDKVLFFIQNVNIFLISQSKTYVAGTH